MDAPQICEKGESFWGTPDQKRWKRNKNLGSNSAISKPTTELAQPRLGRVKRGSSPARGYTDLGVFVPIWLVLRRCEASNLSVFDFALVSPSFRPTQTGLCKFGWVSLQTLTSLNKEVRPFFLGGNSIWHFPSVSSRSDYSIWRS